MNNEAKARSAGRSDVTLKVPRQLYERLQQVVEGSGFHSVTELAVYLLRDVVAHHHRLDTYVAEWGSASKARAEGGEALSDVEVEAIRHRLESLGYL